MHKIRQETKTLLYKFTCNWHYNTHLRNIAIWCKHEVIIKFYNIKYKIIFLNFIHFASIISSERNIKLDKIDESWRFSFTIAIIFTAEKRQNFCEISFTLAWYQIQKTGLNF